MKNFKKVVLLFVLFLGFISVFAQKTYPQSIDKPSEGKSLVYFIRSGSGFMLNFSFYDQDKFIGKFSGTEYLVYECEPGKHMFWATSENRDFVEADLAPNSVYVIHAEGQMGFVIAGVNLKPLNPNEYKDKKNFYRAIKEDKKVVSNNPSEDKSESIKNGLETYTRLKNKNSDKIQVLENSWTFQNADKPIKN